MKTLDVINVLRNQDKNGRYVFTKHDLAKFFPRDSQKSFDEGLGRVVKVRLLKRACRGVYVNEQAQCRDAYTLERVAKALRRNEYNYVSLESILSEYGVISQIPLGRLTVMTTGRSGVYKTAYGVIEFTHTKRSSINIVDHVQIVSSRPLRIATKDAALRDLRRVGRNLHLINEENDDE